MGREKVEVQPRSQAAKALFRVVSSISQSWSGAGSKAARRLAAVVHFAVRQVRILAGLQSCCREELASPTRPASAATDGSIQPDSCHISASELCGNFKELRLRSASRLVKLC